MLLVHAKLLLQQGIPVYADVEPDLETAELGLPLLEVDANCLQVKGLKDGAALAHGCSPLDDLSRLRIGGVNVSVRSDEGDPVLLLLESGLTETQINESMMLALKEQGDPKTDMEAV